MNLNRTRKAESFKKRDSAFLITRLNFNVSYTGSTVVNGHLLAYTSSFNFDKDGNYKEGTNGSLGNPKNLATQTAFSNQQVQNYYEKLVRDAQKIKGNKVIYQIVPVFREMNPCHENIGCKRLIVQVHLISTYTSLMCSQTSCLLMKMGQVKSIDH